MRAQARWARLVLCGLIAGALWTLLSAGLLLMVGGDFLAEVTAARPGAAAPHAMLFLRASNFVASLWAMWLYTALRPQYGAGWRTAAIAGCAWWFIQSLQSAKWVALVGIPVGTTVLPLAATLPAMVIAMVVGAWAYEA